MRLLPPQALFVRSSSLSAALPSAVGSRGLHYVVFQSITPTL